jgi:hypothetical protein
VFFFVKIYLRKESLTNVEVTAGANLWNRPYHVQKNKFHLSRNKISFFFNGIYCSVSGYEMLIPPVEISEIVRHMLTLRVLGESLWPDVR